MPPDSHLISQAMNTLIESEKFIELVEAAETIIHEHPDDYLGYWWKGRALTFIGRHDEAIKSFIESLKHATNDNEESKIMSSISNIYNIQRKYDKTLQYTEIALELNPNNVVAIIARSIALASTGKKREARQLLEDNKRLYEEDYQKACVHAVLKEKDEMLRFLSKAIESNPHNRVTVRFDPDFRLFHRDPEFIKLVSE